MKDLVRLRTSLKEEIEITLNAQGKIEAEASQKYLAMASLIKLKHFLMKEQKIGLKHGLSF